MIDDETLYAYLDGELAPEEARRVERAIDADPALAGKLEAQRAMRARLNALFDRVADQPMPAAIAAAIPRDPTVVNLAERRAMRGPPAAPSALPRWAAIAAALVAGLFGGYALKGTPDSPIVERGGRMIAAAPIEKALNTQLASAGQQGKPVQVRLTFRDTAGDICRSFEARSASGIACRSGDAWRLRALFSGDSQNDATYRTAGAINPAVMAQVDTIIAGEPFDAKAERRALESGWIPR